MLSKAEIEAAVKQHGSEQKAAKALKIDRSTFRRWRQNGVPAKLVALSPKTNGATFTLADFRAAHDKGFIVPRKIREGLKALGSNGWRYESLFAHLAGVSLADLGNFRDAFADHIVEIKRDGRRAWAGTPKLAKEMREMVR
mgnify:CR=1 FL=1